MTEEVICVTFTLIMVYLRATGKIQLKWQWITAPVWIYAVAYLFILLIASISLGTIPPSFFFGLLALFAVVMFAVIYFWES